MGPERAEDVADAKQVALSGTTKITADSAQFHCHATLFRHKEHL